MSLSYLLGQPMSCYSVIGQVCLGGKTNCNLFIRTCLKTSIMNILLKELVKLKLIKLTNQYNKSYCLPLGKPRLLKIWLDAKAYRLTRALEFAACILSGI